MFISRFSARPLASAINSLVELLPQSKAASASATNVLNHVGANLDGASDEITNGVIETRKIVGEVRVQALHADACTTHAAAGLGELGAHGRCSSPLRVLFVRALQVSSVNELFKSVYAALALEPTHGVVQIGIDEPVQRGHGSAVAQVRFILDDNRTAVASANDDREAAAQRATYERFNNVLVVEGRVTKRQRQNSSVRTRRETNPVEWLDFDEDFAAASGAEAVGETSGWNPGSDELAVTSPDEFSGST